MTKIRRILSALTAVTCLTSAVSMTAGATLFSDPADYESAFTYEKLDTDEDGTYDFIRVLKGGASATEVNIPEEIDGLPVTHIFDSAFYGIDTLRSINIPESVTNTGYMGLYNTSLEEINVAEGNTEFSSADGVLFDKDKTAIYQYPSSKAGEEYTVPESVTAVLGNAFSDCKNLKDITISENVNYIGNEAFIRCSSLESITFENPDCQFNEMFETITNGFVDGKGYFNGVIYGYENSTAQAYAKKHDYNFAVIGTEPESTKPVVTSQAVTSQNTAVTTTVNIMCESCGKVVHSYDDVVNSPLGVKLCKECDELGAGGTTAAPYRPETTETAVSPDVTTTVNIMCENCGKVVHSHDDVVTSPLGIKLCKDCSKLGVGGTTASPYRPETTETTVSSENLITDADKILQILCGYIVDSDLAARAFIDDVMPDSVMVEIQEYWNQEEIRKQIKDCIAENNIDAGKVIFIVLETGMPEVPTGTLKDPKMINEILSGFIAESGLAARTFIDEEFFDGVVVEIQEYWNQGEIRRQINYCMTENQIDDTKVTFIVLENGEEDTVNWDKVLYGDNNCDSDISIADAVVLSKYVINDKLFPLPNATAKENANCFYDDAIDSADTLQLLTYNVGGIGIMDMGPADKSHCKMYNN